MKQKSRMKKKSNEEGKKNEGEVLIEMGMLLLFCINISQEPKHHQKEEQCKNKYIFVGICLFIKHKLTIPLRISKRI